MAHYRKYFFSQQRLVNSPGGNVHDDCSSSFLLLHKHYKVSTTKRTFGND